METKQKRLQKDNKSIDVKVAFIFAMREEAEPYWKLMEERPYYTHIDIVGIGRTQASLATEVAIVQGADVVVNIGCCGSTLKSKKLWYNPTHFYDGDFDLSAFGNYTKDPADVNTFSEVDEHSVSIYTYSHFVQDAPKNCLVDMECYDIVAHCMQWNKQFLIYKVVSDNADETADENFDNKAAQVMAMTAEEIIEDVDRRVKALYEAGVFLD